MKAFQKGLHLFYHYVRLELRQPERLLSPLLFAVVFLMVFMFALGAVEPSEVHRLFVAEAFLAGFFALQLCFSRSLEHDCQDGVFALLRSYPLSAGAWFLAKYFLVLVMGVLILLPTLLGAAFFHLESRVDLLSTDLMVVALLSLVGLTAVGVLLSIMTLGVGSRQILYPILYFPLTSPVLLAAVEASKAILIDQVSLSSLLSSWLGLLLVFDIVYFTLGTLLFGELVKAE